MCKFFQVYILDKKKHSDTRFKNDSKMFHIINIYDRLYKYRFFIDKISTIKYELKKHQKMDEQKIE